MRFTVEGVWSKVWSWGVGFLWFLGVVALGFLALAA